MSYHIRNLERNDTFWGPEDLVVYYDYEGKGPADYEALGKPFNWRVVRVEDVGEYDRRIRLAEVKRPWHRITVTLNRDISICDGTRWEPLHRLKIRTKDTLRRRAPEVFYALYPDRRPGRERLRHAIWMAGPGGKLEEILNRDRLVRGSELKIEPLEAVLKCVRFDESHIQLRSTP